MKNSTSATSGQTSASSTPIQVFNTLTNQLETFQPITPGVVKMYVCGPTVYDYAHLGHARCYITWDILYRVLVLQGYDVTYVRNITDVDDKILNRAKAEGKPPEVIAETYAQTFAEDMASLGVSIPQHQPKATDYIQEMFDAIEALIKKGAAYATPDGSVYFRTSAKADYGKLSKKPLDDLRAGARVEVNTDKESPLDFALWKSVPAEDPHAWQPKAPSQIGRGRPGWHLECSAMNHALLGEEIDIHAGGMDLIFPHHENEIAQSECWTDKPFSRYWMHNGFVNVSGEKMSKSLGNFSTIRKVLERYDANTIRYFLLCHHYRTPVDFNDDALEGAKNRFQKIYRQLKSELETLDVTRDSIQSWVDNISEEQQAQYRQQLIELLSEDLNTPKAVVLFDETLSKLGVLRHDWKDQYVDEQRQLLQLVCYLMQTLGFAFDAIFPTVNLPVDALVSLAQELSVDISTGQSGEAILEALFKYRKEAKAQKNWAQADAIRDRLLALHIHLIDHKDGTTGYEVQSALATEKASC